MMQQPTCTNTRIRSTHDAHKIFFAIQHGILPLVTRRLDADERIALRSGCVYAWEERGAHSEITGLGIERFTEGRRWSPSRVRDEFLFYYEKYTPPHDASQPNSVERPAPRDWDPLVKQTYSVWVETPNGRRKWHLTAYFTQATVDQLGTINEIPGVGSLPVPEGLFQSTRTGKSRKSDNDESRGRTKDVFQPTTNVRRYAAFPTGYSGSPASHPDLVPGSTAPERYQQSDIVQNPSFYHSETFFTIPPPPPPSGSHHNLSPLQTSLQSAHDYERRSSMPDSNGVNHHSSGVDMTYHSGPNINPSQSHTFNETNAYLPSSLHNHANLRERFVSYPREVQASTNGNEVAALYGDPSSSWQQTPPSNSPYTLRPTYESSPAHSVIYAHSSDNSSRHDGYSPSLSPASSEQTSSNLSHPRHSPIPECSFPEGRQSSYETTSSVRTKCGPEGEIDPGEGPSRVKLAPLHSLRTHPYRRDPVDDKALRLLRPRAP